MIQSWYSFLSMEELQLSCWHRGEVLTLKLSGRLDGNTATTFSNFVAAKTSVGEKVLALDASALEFVSSAGLRELVLLAKRQAPKRTKLVISGLRGSVREILEISGVISLFAGAEDAAKVAASPGKRHWTNFFSATARS